MEILISFSKRGVIGMTEHEKTKPCFTTGISFSPDYSPAKPSSHPSHNSYSFHQPSMFPPEMNGYLAARSTITVAFGGNPSPFSLS
jgi:hypothetical protein